MAQAQHCDTFHAALLKVIHAANIAKHTVSLELAGTLSSWTCKNCKYQAMYDDLQHSFQMDQHCDSQLQALVTANGNDTHESICMSDAIGTVPLKRRRRWTAQEVSAIENELNKDISKKWSAEDYTQLADKLGNPDLNLRRKVKLLRERMTQVSGSFYLVVVVFFPKPDC